MPIVKKSGVLSSDEAYKLISPVIIELFDEANMDPRAEENVAEKLGFVPFEAVTKGGQIQTKLGIQGTPLVGEWSAYTVDETKYGNKISYDVERAFPGSKMSSEAKIWIEKASGLTDVPEVLKTDLSNSGNDLKEKVKRIKITQNEYLTRIFTEGFKTISAEYGPGSAVYDGKALFAIDHIVAATGTTYSNIIEDDTTSTNYGALTYAHLRKAVDRLRYMKDGIGNRVKRPSNGIFDLIVSPELEGTALDILADLNSFSPYTYTGATASNENFANVWVTRDGFKVRLTVLETMNQPYSQDTSVNVGSATMWFLMNKEGAMMRQAFRDIKFRDTEIEVFYDQDIKATVMTAEKFFGAQALYPECVVGSKGTGAI